MTTDIRRFGCDLEIGGRRLFLRAARGPVADGETASSGILLIHGFPTSSHDWLPIWPGLAARYPLLAPDLLGLGLSEKPFPHRYTVLEQAELIDLLLSQSDITHWHVLAHDLGDSVAQELLARHEEGRLSVRLGGLCFLNGGLFPEAHRPLLVQRLLASPIGPALIPLLGQKAFERSLRRICRQPWPEGTLQQAWQLLNHEQGRRVLPSVLGYIEERREHRRRWLRAMGETNLPMLLINGPEDPVSGSHLADRFAELLPNAQLLRLPGVGHYPQLEAPQAVLKATRDFFARADAALAATA
ncbi:MAG: alpha/beta hydrolase [Xanthomonadales bacterium]|nr:alpha/beta hydrolase [Xanthomonadales bacterium]